MGNRFLYLLSFILLISLLFSCQPNYEVDSNLESVTDTPIDARNFGEFGIATVERPQNSRDQ